MGVSGTKVLVVDDHELMLVALRAALDGVVDFDVVAEARDGDAALLLLERHEPELVLLDIRMPRVDGLECLREIKQRRPEVKVVIFTGVDDPAVLRRAFAYGASACISKLVDPRDLAAVLRQVVEETVVSPFPEPTGVGDQNAIDLTHREREILKWLVEGAPTKTIAVHLELSEPAVKYRLGRMYAKFGVSGRVEAVRFALANDLLGGETRPPLLR
jgi:DNA-binding NarL/FixJ family response regulator